MEAAARRRSGDSELDESDDSDKESWVLVDKQGRQYDNDAKRTSRHGSADKLDEQLDKECENLRDHVEQLLRIIIELRARFEAAQETNPIFKYGQLKSMIHEAITRSKPAIQEQTASLDLVNKAGKRKGNYFKSGYLSTEESERAYSLFALKKKYRAQGAPLRKLLAQLETDYEDSKEYLPHARYDYMKFMIKKIVYAKQLPTDLLQNMS